MESKEKYDNFIMDVAFTAFVSKSESNDAQITYWENKFFWGCFVFLKENDGLHTDAHC